ncbi:MAG: C25 family cysteine peptidase [candidate division WOR-3 bacterium]|nr:C25 family cysteine peptidase [candidate division WOR-3 bacterium]
MIKSCKLLGILISFIINFGFAGELVKEFYFPLSSLQITEKTGYHLVSLKGCESYINEPGAPVVPYKSVGVLIPPTAEITSIEVLEIERREIEGRYLLYPAQPPRPISYSGPLEFFTPNFEIYNSSSEYPGKTYEIIPSGRKSGFRIGGVFIYPLQYIPQEAKLILTTRLKLRIIYTENIYDEWELTESQRETFKEEVRRLVINPEDVMRFAPRVRASENTSIDYIILTSGSLTSRFVPLMMWLRKIGIWADTFSTSWVYSNYSGRDNQEKIRNFIQDYFTTRGTKYVLLGGDISIIPQRGVYSIVNSLPPRIDSFIPCDLYYFDLDWSWDGNQNNIFGDTWTISGRKDTVDLYCDVYGGRWPIENQAEIDSLIQKYFRYVKTPDTLYQKRLLLPAAFLWENYNHVQSQDSIANLSPADWTDRIIDMGQNPSWRNAVRDSLNSGFGLVHLVGHGNNHGVYITSGVNGAMYYRTDPATQSNFNKLAVVNSIACYPGNFEVNDCLAEEMLKARGSAIAVIMNSRYGWGTPPLIGPSELLDIRFYEHLFSRDSIRIASCHQSSKECYRNQAINQQWWRWCYYELNLLGEPSMMIWKDNPKKIAVSYNTPPYIGYQSFVVTCSSGNVALANATVCLWKGSEVYTKGITNSLGQVSLAINPQTLGYMYLTVTAKNRLPYEDSVYVTHRKDVGVEAILNPTGNFDSVYQIIPKARIKNYGTNLETLKVYFRLAELFDDTLIFLEPNSTLDVEFLPWTVRRGTYTAKCSTALMGDVNQVNDVRIVTFQVHVHDIGIVDIITPRAEVESVASIVPKIRVKNYGTVEETFEVVMCIDDYRSRKEIVALVPGEIEIVNFDPWIVKTRGFYTVRCTVYLASDLVPANNVLINHFVVIVPDFACLRIIPEDTTIYLGESITPAVIVGNLGSTNETNVLVHCYIPNTQYNSARTVSLNVGETTLVRFDPWTINLADGNYLIVAEVYLTRDCISANNSIATNLRLLVPGWIIKESLPVFGEIKDGASLTVLDGKIYALQGGNTNNFWMYNIAQDEWYARRSLSYVIAPNGLPLRKNVKAGGALTTCQGRVYAFKGNNTTEFWSYDPQIDSWIIKRPIPEMAPNSQSKKRVKSGAGLVAIRDSIYALKGGNCEEFWVYDVNKDSWYIKKPLIAPYGKKPKAGASLTTVGDTIYALLGGNTYYFYQYIPSRDTWIRKADARFGNEQSIKRKLKDGAALCALGNYIYAIKGGNTQDFGCYVISRDTWITLENIPGPKKVKAGGALVSWDRCIYMLKGGQNREFWRYVPFYNTIYNTTSKTLYNVQKIQNRQIETFTLKPISYSKCLELSFTLRQPMHLTISLYNAIGQQIQVVANKKFIKGSHTIRFDVSSLKPGVYYVRFTGREFEKVSKIVIFGF